MEKVAKTEAAHDNISDVLILAAHLLGLCMLHNKTQDGKNWLDHGLLLIRDEALRCYNEVKTKVQEETKDESIIPISTLHLSTLRGPGSNN